MALVNIYSKLNYLVVLQLSTEMFLFFRSKTTGFIVTSKDDLIL